MGDSVYTILTWKRDASTYKDEADASTSRDGFLTLIALIANAQHVMV